MPRAHDISICVVGFANHKARPDLGDDSGFWLRIEVKDAAPLVEAFKAAPAVFHDFQIEHRVGKESRESTLSAQIAKIVGTGSSPRGPVICGPPSEATWSFSLMTRKRRNSN